MTNIQENKILDKKLSSVEKAELKNRFTGKLIFRDEKGYEEARVGRLFNKRHPKRYPAAILLAEKEEDFVQGVRVAKEQGWKIAVRGGGHSWAVWSVRDDVLLIEGVRFKEITYNEETGIATATPSVKGGEELNSYLDSKGRFFCGGHHPTVGLGGFLLQGGQGWNARGWGWSAEYIVAIDVITADGQLVRADENQNSDLFWAARGAGPGFFGLITRFHLRTIPKPKVLAMSAYTYPVEEFDQVMPWLLETHVKVSPDVELVATTNIAADPIKGYEDVPVFTVLGLAIVNSMEEAERALAPLSTCPVIDRAIRVVEVMPTTFEEQLIGQDHHNPENHRYIADNAWLEGSHEDMISAMRDSFQNLATPKSYALWFSMGPLRELPDMAFSMQTENYVAVYAVSDKEKEEDDQILRRFVTDQMKKMEPVTAGCYLGDSDFTSRQLKFMSDENWEKLKKIQAKYDPGELFIGYLTSDKATLNKNYWEK